LTSPKTFIAVDVHMGDNVHFSLKWFPEYPISPYSSPVCPMIFLSLVIRFIHVPLYSKKYSDFRADEPIRDRLLNKTSLPDAGCTFIPALQFLSYDGLYSGGDFGA